MTEPSLLERIQSDLAAAMKSQDRGTLSTLRMLKAALMEAKTRKAKEALLGRDEEIEVLQRYVKKRRETIEEMRRIGREDRVASEEAEIVVTLRYLPQGLSEDEVRAAVREAITQTGATSAKDAGRVIGAVMAKVKGRAEGGVVSRLVREALGA